MFNWFRKEKKMPLPELLHMENASCSLFEYAFKDHGAATERTRDMEALSRVIDMGAHSLCPQSYEALTQILIELLKAKGMPGECSRVNASRSED